MIYVNSSKEILESYLIEAYRRVYSNSIDEFGNVGDYDVLYNKRNKDRYGRIIIPYDDYYCPDKIQTEIIESLKKEPYIIRNYKTKHYLTTYKKKSLSMNFNLGCAPCCTIRGFKRMHPNIKIELETDEED